MKNDDKNSSIDSKSVRKTLSLNGNRTTEGNSQLRRQSDNGQFKVEVKRKRSRIKNSHNLGERRFGFDSNRNNKLTDDEFKARVQALQNAIQQESASKPTTVGEVNKPQNENKTIEVKQSTLQNTKDIKNSQEGGIIEKLIKMAPKNNKPVVKEPIKPVVFRSDAFIRNKSTNTKNNGSNNNKQISKQTRRTTKNEWHTEKNKKNERKKDTVRQDYSNSTISFVDNTKMPNPNEKNKNVKSNNKYKSNKEKKEENFVIKSNKGKFSKRDLDLAMNDSDSIRTRSVASIKRAKQRNKNDGQKISKPIVREVNIPDSITIGELAIRMAVRASEIVKYLMSVGTMATINQIIDGETAEIICTSFGHIAKRVSDDDFEKELDYSVFDNEDNMTERAPVVAVMGHVDHGKTTLLDALRRSSVAKKESGGITQHVAAYQVRSQSGKVITFIDTPGHAAFSNMRERGANITDTVVLVVAADDGVKEQTIEVIRSAKRQNVPIVVAINKIDKPDIDVNKVKNELMQHEVLLEEFGGDVLGVEISAKNNINLDKLLETILLQAEVLMLRANIDRKADCTVLETRMEKGRGIVASVIVNGGTLKIGDVFVVGTTYGKIRTITNSNGERIKFALPSQPVEITGLDKSPKPGDVLTVVDSEQQAHEISEKRREQEQRKKSNKVSISNIKDTLAETEQNKKIPNLNLYLKADVYGSLEAIEWALLGVNRTKITTTVIGKSIGPVNESDIAFAKMSDACIVSFNTTITQNAKNIARSAGVEIIAHDVIYHLINAVVEKLETMLPTIIEKKYIGKAVVKKLFFISRLGTIAGCVVTDGSVKRNNSCIKVVRNEKCVFEGEIKSMKHEKDEIKECGLNKECGILIENFNDFKEGDTIESYEINEKKQKLQG